MQRWITLGSRARAAGIVATDDRTLEQRALRLVVALEVAERKRRAIEAIQPVSDAAADAFTGKKPIGRPAVFSAALLEAVAPLCAENKLDVAGARHRRCCAEWPGRRGVLEPGRPRDRHRQPQATLGGSTAPDRLPFRAAPATDRMTCGSYSTAAPAPSTSASRTISATAGSASMATSAPPSNWTDRSRPGSAGNQRQRERLAVVGTPSAPHCHLSKPWLRFMSGHGELWEYL